MKERALRSLFAGTAAVELEAAGKGYAATLPARYRSETLAHIDKHKGQGHTLVLVSASLGVYARPAAATLGFDHVIAVEMEADQRGILTGNMTGPNVRGPEKRNRLALLLRSEIGDDEVELWAYGNSSGDAELLDMADHATWVGKRRAVDHDPGNCSSGVEVKQLQALVRRLSCAQ